MLAQILKKKKKKKERSNPLHLTLKHFPQFTPIQLGTKTYLNNVLHVMLKAKELEIFTRSAITEQKMFSI